MSDLHDDDFLPPELAEVGRRLRAERAQATPLELDRIKVQARARARRKASPWSISLKGRSMRSRYLVLALTALLLGGTTAGGIAGGGGSSSGYGSATSQYRPPICNRDRSVCACPGGSMFNDDQLQCVCPQGESFDNYGRCQPSKPPPPPPPPCKGKGKGYNGYGNDGCKPPPPPCQWGCGPPPPPPCQWNCGRGPGNYGGYGNYGGFNRGYGAWWGRSRGNCCGW